MCMIEEISEKKSWDLFLSLCKGHDFYHTWDFHALSQENGEGTPILFRVSGQGGGLIVPLLSREIHGTSYKDLTSVYGYPSPLIYGEVESAEIMGLWEKLICFLREKGYVSLFSRLHPLLTPEPLQENIGNFCGKIVFINLRLSEKQQLSNYRKRCLTGIRSLERRNVLCCYDKVESCLQDFIKNYEATMRIVKAEDKYFFSKKYYFNLLEAKNFDARIYFCKYEKHVVCSGLFVFCNDFVQYHLGGTNPEFYKLSPTKLMFEKVRRDAVAEGKKYFILGGGLGSLEDSLFKFKAGFSKLTADFHVTKLILHQEIYEELSSGIPGISDFFPAYRQNG